MDEGTRNSAGMSEAIGDPLHERLRGWIRGAIEALLQEEVEAMLQVARYAREAEGPRVSACESAARAGDQCRLDAGDGAAGAAL